ncbi:PHIKZ117.1 [Pseudomonas phage phiKZ]|uniref:PHIKZ117.1 n=1 Tax=Pseudomonas phage phiKZ TaxID=2905945 RepID=L7SZ18_BPDPK|nr:PHIKZ117.1 [Pseudomonas phage phiKZ]AGC26331.1 PHIKZ117.1 [Pseudomonas phage phiKZ]
MKLPLRSRHWITLSACVFATDMLWVDPSGLLKKKPTSCILCRSGLTLLAVTGINMIVPLVNPSPLGRKC